MCAVAFACLLYMHKRTTPLCNEILLDLSFTLLYMFSLLWCSMFCFYFYLFFVVVAGWFFFFKKKSMMLFISRYGGPEIKKK
jgi:hypothetical protein